MSDLKIVKSILSAHYSLVDNPTYLFGSRVEKCHRPDSDLDILIIDKTLRPETLTLLEEEFEESSLLYKVDIILRSRIDHEFYNKIKGGLKQLV